MKKPDNREFGSFLLKLLSLLLPAGILSILITAATYLYQGYMKEPIIKCVADEKTLSFSIDGDFRSVQMRIYPQMIIRYDNQVILLIHLKDYFEEEFLQFQNDGTCEAVICHGNYADKLGAYLKENIIQEAILKDSSLNQAELEEHIKVEISSIGGVRYMNEQGNCEKRYCIIETNGLVFDVEADSEEIKNRLQETELPTSRDLISIGGANIQNIVYVLSEEVIKIIRGG